MPGNLIFDILLYEFIGRNFFLFVLIFLSLFMILGFSLIKTFLSRREYINANYVGISKDQILIIGIRKEDKGKWEKRAPFAPVHVAQLTKSGFKIIVERSSNRAFTDGEYEKAGAVLQDDIEEADLIFGVKEVPIDKFIGNKTYFFFSHTIKGQTHNMPSLKKMMEKNITLVDYERIVNSEGRRLVFFGPFAGNAGMIDSLWGIGKKWLMAGYTNPFLEVKQTHNYYNLEEAKEALRKIGNKIKSNGFHPDLSPVVIGFSGYGNVSLGAQDILDQLPVTTIGVNELFDGIAEKEKNPHTIYKVVFTLSDLYQFRNGDEFDKFVFFKSPELFESKFQNYSPSLTMLVNAIYWSEKADRILKKSDLQNKRGKLDFVADISCDINGGIEITSEPTTPEYPFLNFNTVSGRISRGLSADGVSVLAVDNLPCELSLDATNFFGDELTPIIQSAGSSNFDDIGKWPKEIQNAVILNKGKLTEKYQYLTNHL